MSEKPNNPNPGSIPTPADFFGWINQVLTPMTQATAAFTTNVPTPADPLTMWRNFTEKNEEIYSKFLQQLVSTPAFAQSLGRSASATARYREMVKQTAKIYLETADMPSREDVTRLAEQIVALDAKVDDLNDSLSEASPEVPQALGKVVTTLESLAGWLGNIENQLNRQNEMSQNVAAKIEGIEARLNQQNTEVVAERLERQENLLTLQREIIDTTLGRAEDLRNQLHYQNEQVVALAQHLSRVEDRQNEIASSTTQQAENLLNRQNEIAGGVFQQLDSLLNSQNGNNGGVFERLERLEASLTNLANNGIAERLARLETQLGQTATATSLQRLETRLNSLDNSPIVEKLAQLEKQLGNLESKSNAAAVNLPTMESVVTEANPEPVLEIEATPANATEPTNRTSRSRKKPVTTTQPITES